MPFEKFIAPPTRPKRIDKFGIKRSTILRLIEKWKATGHPTKVECAIELRNTLCRAERKRAGYHSSIYGVMP